MKGSSLHHALRRGAALSAVLVARLMYAQSDAPPSLKGHAIGESLQTYLEHVPGGPRYLDSCSKVDSSKSARKLKVDYKFCGSLLAAMKGTDDLIVHFPQTDFNPSLPPSDEEHAVFHDGHLALIRFAVGLTRKVLLGLGEEGVRSTLPTVPYEDVYGDMVSKFGKESTAGTDKFQNAFGAVIIHRRAIWLYHDTYVAAIAELDSSEDTPVILVQLASRDELGREMDLAAKNRKSTID